VSEEEGGRGESVMKDLERPASSLSHEGMSVGLESLAAWRAVGDNRDLCFSCSSSSLLCEQHAATWGGGNARGRSKGAPSHRRKTTRKKTLSGPSTTSRASPGASCATCPLGVTVLPSTCVLRCRQLPPALIRVCEGPVEGLRCRRPRRRKGGEKRMKPWRRKVGKWWEGEA